MLKKHLSGWAGLLFFSVMAHAEVNGYDHFCSDDEVVGGVASYLLAIGVESNKYGKYYEQINPDDKTLKFQVRLLASEKLSNEEIYKELVARIFDEKFAADVKPGGIVYNRYMNHIIYKQYYELENQQGFKVISERFMIKNKNLKGDSIWSCSDVGKVFIVSDSF